MKVVCLLENTKRDEDHLLENRHGISVYIEASGRKVLFDTGPDNSFAVNARQLGIDLSAVDMLILSHGHHDHTGGLKDFLKVNERADIYVHPRAFIPHYSKTHTDFPRFIGTEKPDGLGSRLIMITRGTSLGDGMEILTDADRDGYVPTGNRRLYTESETGDLVPDDFSHEIYLLIREAGKSVLITGCSHAGAGNIVRTAFGRTGIDHLDAVIGGFHLKDPQVDRDERIAGLDRLSRELEEPPVGRYYTGHCTGEDAYGELRRRLPGRLEYFRTGSVLTF